MKQKLKQIKIRGARYLVRSHTFAGRHFWFDCTTLESRSYFWWPITKVIRGKLIFNDYFYSKMTSNDQHKSREILKALNVKVDHYIEAPRGLNDLGTALENYYYKRAKIELDLSRPRRKKSLDDSRWSEIDSIDEKINLLKSLGAKCTKSEIEEIYESILKNELIRISLYEAEKLKKEAANGQN